MYWLIFIALLIGAYLEVSNKRINIKRFYIIYTILILLATLRQGQGSDYYNYLQIYNEIRDLTRNSVFPILLSKDPGYSLLNYLAISVGCPFELFSALCSFGIMLILLPYFRDSCSKSLISLFIFYTTFYLIYPFSAIRQGFTIAFFVSVLYPLLREKKHLLYALLTIIASSIHSSLLVVLVVPFVYEKTISRNKLLLVIILSLFVLFIYNPFERIVSLSGYNRFSDYLDKTSMSYLAILIRGALVTSLFLIPERIYRSDRELNNIRILFVLGFFIYSVFSFSDLIASRLFIYFQVLQGLFLVRMIYSTNLKKISHQLCSCFLLISTVLFVKNINSFIVEGKYQNCTVLSYPYLSLFDSKSEISYYRKDLGFANSME